MANGDPLATLGRLLVGLGALLLAVGLALWGLSRLGLAGRLPGDFVVRRGRWTLVAPLATSLFLSAVLTLAVNLWLRLRR